MKNCPYCKAQLADEADFCLYCMKPLSEKEIIPPTERRPKGWLFVLGGILLLAAIVLLGLLPGNRSDPAPDTGSTTLPSTAATTIPSFSTSLPTASTTIPTTATTTPTISTTAPTVTTAKPIGAVVYNYRAAQAGDDFYAGYQNPGDHIVITGVDQGAADGIYDIPSTIDGKTVIAIMSNAFYGSGARTVYIPASVKTVHDYAFNDCPLTDVYFRGKAIFCYLEAFPAGFTLHCSADCHDRDLRYYKFSATNYSATWQEWNGET